LNLKLLGKNEEIVVEFSVRWDLTCVDELDEVRDGVDWSFGETYFG
jgi:hypothetical protein